MRGKLISGAHMFALVLIAASAFAQTGTGRDNTQPPPGTNPPSGTDRDRDPSSRDPANLDQNRTRTDGQQFSVSRSSKVVGSTIRDTQGKEIGRIQDLAVDPQTGRIAYAVTTLNAAPGSGTGTAGVGKSYAIPYRTLQTDPSGNLTLDSSAVTAIQQGDGFDANTWPDMTDRQWAERTHTRFGQQPYWQGQPGGDRQMRIVRLSQLTGTTLNDSGNQRLGTVRDVLIDTHQGRVTSVVGDFGSSVPSMSNKLTAVPWSKVPVSENETDRSTPRRISHLTVDVDRKVLETAPTFTDSEWPRGNDREFFQKVNRHYNAPDRDLDRDNLGTRDLNRERDPNANPNPDQDRDTNPEKKDPDRKP